MLPSSSPLEKVKMRWSLALPFATASVSDPSKLVMMHYMPWFDTPETNGGQWGIHWTMANRHVLLVFVCMGF